MMTVMRLPLRIPVTAIVWATVMAPPSVAASAVHAELIAASASLRPGQPSELAVRLRMEPGWHTYWSNPGDSGLATTVRWTLPEGFRAGELQWPVPQRLGEPPIVSFGYEHDVLLLSTVDVPSSLAAGSTAKLAARVDWVECKDICVKGGADVALTLPVQDREPTPSPEAAAMAEARERAPVEPFAWTFAASKNQDRIVLAATPVAGSLPAPARVTVFPLEPAVLEHSADQPLKTTPTQWLITLTPSTFATAFPTRLRAVVVSEAGWLGAGVQPAVQINVPIK